MSVYGATKAFVLSFTESLWGEARGTGLRVLAVCPGAMQTEFFDVAGSQSADYGTKRATPEQVVTIAVDTLDRRSAPPSVITNADRSPSPANSCHAATWSASATPWLSSPPQAGWPPMPGSCRCHATWRVRARQSAGRVDIRQAPGSVVSSTSIRLFRLSRPYRGGHA
ncbi:SDR family NAD(P)-dependent oxidoreductase [Nocardia sp. NPDC052278]|uniref:SDR family NAD(P)-dependent oxidoreductase n=1 Tax=unclassified Nocardia TaxID=2637762 RepID=UPI0036B821A4